jgi:hypothetical protein
MHLDRDRIRAKVAAAGFKFLSTEFFDHNRRLEIQVERGNRKVAVASGKSKRYPMAFEDIMDIDAAADEAIKEIKRVYF